MSSEYDEEDEEDEEDDIDELNLGANVGVNWTTFLPNATIEQPSKLDDISDNDSCDSYVLHTPPDSDVEVDMERFLNFKETTKLEVGVMFKDKLQIKDVIKEYAMENKKNLVFKKNDKKRMCTIMATYSHIIIPTNDPQLWPTNVTHPINHPVMWRSIGRSKKNRNKVNDEPRTRNTRPRTLQTIKCKKCGSFDHNKRTCKGKRVAKRLIPKGGNKKAGKKG
ncbi:hypothetical protein KIW84_062873 [Lathyrus oleraceus]|uniref:Uncharacterized protein n=1 Tax=Pisum sativum TaxID=3888 RepID=A0A9D4W9Y2_PEA|nr:hypothetical protein KIW84_062873 [Pisum sativum]